MAINVSGILKKLIEFSVLFIITIILTGCNENSSSGMDKDKIKFKPPVVYSTGSDPRSVAIFDRYGYPILIAVANYESNTISTFLCENGVIEESAPITEQNNPIHIILYDLDNSGDPHMAVARNGSTKVALYGKLLTVPQLYLTYEAGSNPSNICMIDVDNAADHNIELAFTASGSNRVSTTRGISTTVLFNTYTVGSDPRSITIADFDMNGRVSELATANYGNSTISIIGALDDSTSVSTFSASGLNPVSLTSFNVKSDAMTYLAVANYGSDNISIYMITPDVDNVEMYRYVGSCLNNYAVGKNPVYLITADFNKDTKADLAVANYSDDNISILLGNDDGTFKTPLNFNIGEKPTSIAASDLNLDGKIDIAVTISTGLAILMAE